MQAAIQTIPHALPVPLYVATDLSVIAPEPPPTAADVTIAGRIYRRLDPLYYAWLRSRVTKAGRERGSNGTEATCCGQPLYKSTMPTRSAPANAPEESPSAARAANARQCGVRSGDKRHGATGASGPSPLAHDHCISRLPPS